MGKAGVMAMRLVKRTIGFVLIFGVLCGLVVTEAAARQRMSFRPGDRSRPSYHRGYSARPARHFGGRHASRGSRSRPASVGRHGGGGGGGGDEGEGAGTARPGAGFTMENGVLTYPAPERFQPRNLPHR